MRRTCGARTPEELELLLEDALLLRDRDGVAALFEPGAILATGGALPVTSGDESARLALSLWNADRPYLAQPRQVVMTRDLGLIVAERGMNVVRRDQSGAWRYAIVWQSADETDERTTQ